MTKIEAALNRIAGDWPMCDVYGCREEAAQDYEATRHWGTAKVPKVTMIEGDIYHFCEAHRRYVLEARRQEGEA